MEEIPIIMRLIIRTIYDDVSSAKYGFFHAAAAAAAAATLASTWSYTIYVAAAAASTLESNHVIVAIYVLQIVIFRVRWPNIYNV